MHLYDVHLPNLYQDNNRLMGQQAAKSIVAPCANAGEGSRRIDWARTYMPILRNLIPDFERDKPFRNLKIGICLHVEPKMGVWLEVLRAGGAEVSITGSPGTTDDDTAAALVEHMDVNVYSTKDETFDDHLMYCQLVLSSQPDLIADNGADLHNLIYSHPQFRPLASSLIGATEETTSGATWLADSICCKDFPTLIINNTQAKRIVENRYGVGSSVVDGIMRATNVMLHGKNVVVIGYGYCGTGIAQRFRGMGAHVTVVESEPLTRLEAHLEGFKTACLEECLPTAEIVVTVTGHDGILLKDHFALLPSGAIVANAGHFASEIDVPGLEDLAVNVREIRSGIREYKLPNGTILFLLAEGNLINLAAGDGNPIEIMDLGLALQALSLRHLAEHGQSLAREPQSVPWQVERYVASKAVEHWIERQSATQAQNHGANSSD